MKISVIIPFYNEINLISRAVDSVIINSSMEYKFEILICNDGILPEDFIRSHLSVHANKLTRILSNCNPKGPGGARNTGLDASSGELVAFLDADDFWFPGKVKAQFEMIQKGATFVATSYCFGNQRILINPPKYIDNSYDIFLRRGIGTSTVMICRSLCLVSRFRDIRFAQDIDFWFAIARDPLFKYFSINNCFVEYGINGSTKNKLVQLHYLLKVLMLNKIPYIIQIRVLTSYIVMGIHNHFIKFFFNK
jgi:glycosyltransferase involved in cell wall biosynthesis